MVNVKMQRAAWILPILLGAILMVLALDSSKAATVRHDLYPLKMKSAGPRVCDLQWLLMGKRPSVYRDSYFQVRKAKPSCYFGVSTRNQLGLLKYRLGQPKPYTLTYTAYLRDIVTGKKPRPSKWVALAVSRRTSGSVMLKAYPVPDRGRLIGFPRMGTHTLGNWQSDNAVDISCAPGSRIVAPIPGRLFGGYGYLGVSGSRFAGQRINMVGLYRQRTVQFYLAHMTVLTVQPFQVVTAGEKIGTCGPANGIYHLHIGASYGFPIQEFIEGRY